jgi:hypothetical protein
MEDVNKNLNKFFVRISKFGSIYYYTYKQWSSIALLSIEITSHEFRVGVVMKYNENNPSLSYTQRELSKEIGQRIFIEAVFTKHLIINSEG